MDMPSHTVPSVSSKNSTLCARRQSAGSPSGDTVDAAIVISDVTVVLRDVDVDRSSLHDLLL